MKEIAIVGGGISGLTAAVLLGRKGHKVTIYEQGQSVGGRGRTRTVDRFRFNMGAHALYRNGAAAKLMKSLGVKLTGGVPPINHHARVLMDGQLYMLPGTARGLLQTTALSAGEKLGWGGAIGRLMLANPNEFRDVTFDAWLRERFDSTALRGIVTALTRVATYTNHVDLSAWAGLMQMQLVLNGSVLYMDDGWAQWVNQLVELVKQSGGQIRTRTRVTAMDTDAARPTLSFADGGSAEADAVIVAASPAVVEALLPEVVGWDKLQPVEAACLNLGLRDLPNPKCKFAAGSDAPLYYSVHTPAAKLTDSGYVVHLMKYLPVGATAEEGAMLELEAFMDQLQPGWRMHEATRQFLPKMTVTHAASLAARPRPRVKTTLPDIFLAGDWVGDEGLLVDAAVSSALRAVELIG